MRIHYKLARLLTMMLIPFLLSSCSEDDQAFALITILSTVIAVGGIWICICFNENKKNSNVREAAKKLPNTFKASAEGLKTGTNDPKYSGSLLYYDATNKKVAMIHASMSSFQTKIVDDFEFSYSRICPHQTFVFDDKNRQIEVFEYTKDLTSFRIKYEDIHSVSLLIDDVTIYSKSSTRTVGGALVGGALFGSAGAVVGGLSGDIKVHGKVKSVKIKILIKDPSNPTRIITLLSGAEFEKDIARPYIEDGTAVQDTIKIIIDMLDREDADKFNDVTSQTSSSSNLSISEELLKLAELKEKGILTEEEFQAQKHKILNQ